MTSQQELDIQLALRLFKPGGIGHALVQAGRMKDVVNILNTNVPGFFSRLRTYDILTPAIAPVQPSRGSMMAKFSQFINVPHFAAAITTGVVGTISGQVKETYKEIEYIMGTISKYSHKIYSNVKDANSSTEKMPPRINNKNKDQLLARIYNTLNEGATLVETVQAIYSEIYDDRNPVDLEYIFDLLEESPYRNYLPTGFNVETIQGIINIDNLEGQDHKLSLDTSKYTKKKQAAFKKNREDNSFLRKRGFANFGIRDYARERRIESEAAHDRRIGYKEGRPEKQTKTGPSDRSARKQRREGGQGGGGGKNEVALDNVQEEGMVSHFVNAVVEGSKAIKDAVITRVMENPGRIVEVLMGIPGIALQAGVALNSEIARQGLAALGDTGRVVGFLSVFKEAVEAMQGAINTRSLETMSNVLFKAHALVEKGQDLRTIEGTTQLLIEDSEPNGQDGGSGVGTLVPTVTHAKAKEAQEAEPEHEGFDDDDDEDPVFEPGSFAEMDEEDARIEAKRNKEEEEDVPDSRARIPIQPQAPPKPNDTNFPDALKDPKYDPPLTAPLDPYAKAWQGFNNLGVPGSSVGPDELFSYLGNLTGRPYFGPGYPTGVDDALRFFGAVQNPTKTEKAKELLSKITANYAGSIANHTASRIHAAQYEDRLTSNTIDLNVNPDVISIMNNQATLPHNQVELVQRDYTNYYLSQTSPYPLH